MVSVLDVRICGLPSGTEIWGKDTGLNVGALRPVRPNSELGRVDRARAGTPLQLIQAQLGHGSRC